MRAVLRRAEVSGPPVLPPSTTFEAAGLRVDLRQQRVFVEGQEVSLTPTEYRLLCELVRYAGRVLTLEHLLDRVWGLGYEGQEYLVRKIVYRLRQKIEPTPGSPQYILTKSGMGYLLDLPA